MVGQKILPTQKKEYRPVQRGTEVLKSEVERLGQVTNLPGRVCPKKGSSRRSCSEISSRQPLSYTIRLVLARGSTRSQPLGGIYIFLLVSGQEGVVRISPAGVILLPTQRPSLKLAHDTSKYSPRENIRLYGRPVCSLLVSQM